MNEPSNELQEQQALEQALHRLAYQMAQALAELDCPDCCGEVHTFIEYGCEVYQEEREWACFVQLVRYRSGGSRGRG